MSVISNFVQKVSECTENFTHSQKRIAAYLMENMDNLAFGSLGELAEKVGTSTTTIIRFARAMGYEGYSDMQKDVLEDIRNRGSLPERLENGKAISGDQLFMASFQNDINNIHKTMEAQDPDDLKKAVDLVSGASTVYILGMRSSFSIAHYLVSRLGEIKRDVRLIQSTGMIYPEEIIGAGEGDVCIAFLFPRYSKLSATIIAWLRNAGVKVMLITSLNSAAVSGYGDVILPCAVTSVSYKNSFAAPLCLTNYLVAAIARDNYEEARSLLERTETILSQGYYLGL